MLSALARSKFDLNQASLKDFEEDRFDGVIAQKANLDVVPITDFLATFFPNIKLTGEEMKEMEKQRNALSYIDLETISDETRLSADLVKGINVCCPRGTDLRYFDTHPLKGASAEPIPGLTKRQAQDGLVTSYWSEDIIDESNYRIFETATPSGTRFKASLLTPISKNPGIIFEHKLPSKLDVNFTAGQGGNLTSAQAELWLQKYGYDMSQWSTCEPYRHLIGVTVAGNYMRFWGSGPSGSCASEAFEYRHDATPLFQLLHMYGKSNLSHDVGPDRLFQPIPQNRVSSIEKCCQVIAKAYAAESRNKEWLDRWYNRVNEKRGIAWTFNVEHHASQEVVGGSSFQSANAPRKVVVLSVPISHQTRMMSRGTRCYLAFDYALMDRNPFHPKTPAKEVMAYIHTLKTSWISPLRSPEFEFYQKAIARRTQAETQGMDSQGVHMATMLSGGYVRDSLQDYSHGYGKKIGSREKSSSHPCQINWLLMKEVGRPLGTFKSGREFLTAIRDTAETLEMLYDLQILHRDVSANNVLIDIVTGRGLLIDFDLAKDLAEVKSHQRPALTGTNNFISLAFSDNKLPLHTSWHDLESLYWTTLYVSIRHKGGLSAGIENSSNLSHNYNRTVCLGDIFPNRRNAFLKNGRFHSGDDSGLNHFILKMRDIYEAFYSLIARFNMWVTDLATPLDDLRRVLSETHTQTYVTKIADTLANLATHKAHEVYEQHGKQELEGYIQRWLDLGQILEAKCFGDVFGSLPNTLRREIEGACKQAKTIQSQLQDLLFPDTESFLDYLDEALSPPKETSDRPGIVYNAPRQTTKGERLRHSVGISIPSTLSSHHSQARFHVIDETKNNTVE